MNKNLKDQFMGQWKEYFPGAELPIVFYYSDDDGNAEIVKKPSDHVCAIGVLNKVRKGKSLCFNADSIGCFGGKRYLGYSNQIRPNFEYFLSYGIFLPLRRLQQISFLSDGIHWMKTITRM
jgi:hypothetical protein